MLRFPLFSLIEKPLLHIIRNMEMADIIAFSFCSKTAKKTVKSLNFKAISFEISVHVAVDVLVTFENQYSMLTRIKSEDNFGEERPENVPRSRFYTPNRIEVGIYHLTGKTKWEIRNMEVKEWISHCSKVFNRTKIDCLLIEFDNFELGSIQESVNGLEVIDLTLGDNVPNDVMIEALRTIPYSKSLFLYTHQLATDFLKELRKAQTQNLDKFAICQALHFKIDDLLMTNSLEIQLNESSLTEKDLNRFLKLWMSGCNPRLKYMFLRGRGRLENEDLDASAVLRRIKYRIVENEEIYKRRVSEDYFEEDNLKGGFRIKRFDGTEATVVLKKNELRFVSN